MKHIVYRIEHKNSGIGPFEQAGRNESKRGLTMRVALHDLFKGYVPNSLQAFDSHRRLEITSDDCGMEWAKDYYFACKSIEALYAYFPVAKSNPENFHKHGFVMAVYEIEDEGVFRDDIQLAFLWAKAMRLKEIPFS